MEKVNNQEHGTTFEIPLVRFQDENLTLIQSIPPYIVKRREERQVSKDCFISIFGNRYSVPWKYARQNVTVEIFGERVIVESDGIQICEHRLIEGRHQVSRQKEHFEGLLKAAKDESYGKMPPVIISSKKPFEDSAVIKRSLSEYDQIIGGK
ncbi:Mu transposase domain-containing protein [Methanospirillum stamsii]|uniref:Transposase for insertion sequence element IS21-like C-terminal domain-containing protein n=1 Tax=Methanospirillum stamsii TaxID=1277351 RepID=A0A2V2MUY2_9EURY|nr:hypothetical protein [Methanospirillum stamsii]PWR71189.1 hypothetical protein DLD82_13790 [Methanospirillum stamsii]